MKELIASWRESLMLLRPSALKMFGLLTLNSWVKAWKVCWMYVTPIAVVTFAIVEHRPINGTFIGESYSRAVYLLLAGLINFLILIGMTVASSLFIAAARPSVARKDGSYFLRILFHYIPVIALLRLGIFLPKPMGMWWARLLMVTMITPVMLFFTVFLFDMPAWRLKSYWRAIRNAVTLFVFNFPLCLVAMIAQGILYIPAGLLVALSTADKKGTSTLLWLCGTAGFILFCVLMSLTTCYWVNLYVKRVHDQPNLYM